MNDILPPFLKKGDHVALISPSGVIDEALVLAAKEVYESWGLVAEIGTSALKKNGRFAGTDEDRIADITWALTDKKIKAIFCNRGGYGLVRLVGQIDFNKCLKTPKWVVGFSDVTVLHSVLSNYDICSVHAIMAKHVSENPESLPVVYLKKILFGEMPSYTIPSYALNKQGEVTGKLLGGNLSVLYGLRATPFDVNFDDAILFLEDVSERTYHIDRMVQNLKLSGVFGKIAGLIVGQFSDVDFDESFPLSPYEIINEAIKDYSFPVCYNFPAGHVSENFPLVLGRETMLRVSENQSLII